MRTCISPLPPTPSTSGILMAPPEPVPPPMAQAPQAARAGRQCPAETQPIRGFNPCSDANLLNELRQLLFLL